jgi:hypothetical protein
MAISGALRIADESSPNNKDRARESLLSTLAHPAAPSAISSRRQFAFAIVQAALITVGALGLMVGVASAAELSLRSVAEHVVNTLAEPLPLSAEGQRDSAGLNAGEQETGDESASSGRPVDPADGGAVADGAIVPPVSPDVGDPNAANPRAQGGQPSPTNPPGSNPQDNNGIPPGSGGQNQGGDHGNQPGTTKSPGQNASHNGEPDRNGHNGSDGPGDQGDSSQQGQTDSNGNGSNGGGSNSGGPKLSTGDAPNGSNGGLSSGANSNASNKASTDHSLIFTLY